MGERQREMIMSNDNTTDTGAWKSPPMPAVRGKGKVAGEKAPQHDVEVVSLEIADDDFGGDPYNHTGTHCVLKIDDNS